MGGSRRARTASARSTRTEREAAAPNGAGDRGAPAGPRGTAKDRALRLLGERWRSREELRSRLTAAGFDPEQVESALVDLTRVGLIDDARFAREVVKAQAGRRLAGDRAIREALRAKGVARAEVDAALEAAGDEGERASALAERQAYRLRALAPDAAYRRIVGMLARRGYSHSVAREAAERALADRSDASDGAGKDV